MIPKRAAAILCSSLLAAAIGAAAGVSDQPAATHPFPVSLRSIRAKAEEATDSGRIPSLVIGVEKHGESIWDEGFGWADRERKIKATSNTIYQVASLSKSLTATGVFLLVDRRQVSLDRPLDHYLGSIRLEPLGGAAVGPSVRDVLNMTGGIPHGWLARYVGTTEAGWPPSADALATYCGVTAFPPGKHFHYSNLSYGLAERVIAQASGTRYEDFMQRELFRPLGMERTMISVPSHLKDQVATPYDFANHPARTVDFYPKGAAGFYSTAHDLLRFGRFHLQEAPAGAGVLVKPETMVAIHRPERPANVRPRYANGWGIFDMGDLGQVLMSNGEFRGVGASLLLLPAQGLAIVCLTNGNGHPRPSDAFTFEIAEVLVPGIGEKMKTAISRAEKGEGESQPLANLCGRWQGHVHTLAGTHHLGLEVGENGKVSVTLNDSSAVSLEKADFNGTRLVGSFRGSLDAVTSGGKPSVELELYQDGDLLQGFAGLDAARKELEWREAVVLLHKR
jgi:CubicO group peptidase (beta-lactamase class C family)